MPAPNLPAQWRRLAAKAGVTSYADIARKAGGGLSSSTVQRTLTGKTKPEPVTIRRIAEAFRVTPETIARLLQVEIGELGWWDPPLEAHRLDAEARDALEGVIRVLAKERARDAETPADSPTPLTPKTTTGQPTEPDLHDTLPDQPHLRTYAAKRANSQGRRIEHEFDKLGQESQVVEDEDQLVNDGPGDQEAREN